jgi:TolB-like protein
MNAAIKRLRAALGDAAESPQFVETLHRRGYRFIAAVDPTDTAGRPAAAPLPSPRPRLVVLPFANLGSDAPDYFSDGLTEEMIMQLGAAAPIALVLARVVDALQERHAWGERHRRGAPCRLSCRGSVRHEGDRVRITAQLIETKGETHLWAESYDGPWPTVWSCKPKWLRRSRIP